MDRYVLCIVCKHTNDDWPLSNCHCSQCVVGSVHGVPYVFLEVFWQKYVNRMAVLLSRNTYRLSTAHKEVKVRKKMRTVENIANIAVLRTLLWSEFVAKMSTGSSGITETNAIMVKKNEDWMQLEQNDKQQQHQSQQLKRQMWLKKSQTEIWTRDSKVCKVHRW